MQVITLNRRNSENSVYLRSLIRTVVCENNPTQKLIHLKYSALDIIGSQT